MSEDPRDAADVGRHGLVASGSNPWLADRLTMPAISVTPLSLSEVWQRTTITVFCARPQGLEEGVWMIGALRGAWLWMMEDMPAPGPLDPDPFGRATPFEAFYHTHARTTRRNDVPKPYWFEVDLLPRNRLEIRLTLFGFADIWRDAAIEALLLALEHGISIRERARIDAPWPVLDWWWTLERRLPLREPARDAILCTSGVSVRRPVDPARDAEGDMLMRLAERLSGLARWQFARLDADWSALRSSTRTLRFTVSDEVSERRTRMSVNSGGRPIPMPSLQSRIAISRLSETWWALLQLAETCGLGGGDATFGYGRVILV